MFNFIWPPNYKVLNSSGHTETGIHGHSFRYGLSDASKKGRQERGEGFASAGLYKALHVPALCPPQGQDAFLGQQVQGAGVDALLIYHHESLPIFAHLQEQGSALYLQ